MIDEEKEQIWLYISRGYTFSTEYVGGDLAIRWFAYYKDIEIGNGYTEQIYNYDEIINIWKTHWRDRVIGKIIYRQC